MSWNIILKTSRNYVMEFHLGLLSNAVDQKQPMLCESLRHQRRDLALALIVHSHLNDSQVDAILQVLLNKERYSFMMGRKEQLQQEAHNKQPICNDHTQITVKQNGGTKKKKPKRKSCNLFFSMNSKI